MKIGFLTDLVAGWGRDGTARDASVVAGRRARGDGCRPDAQSAGNSLCGEPLPEFFNHVRVHQ